MKLLALILWLVLLAAPTFMMLMWLEAEDREGPIEDEPPTEHHREM